MVDFYNPRFGRVVNPNIDGVSRDCVIFRAGGANGCE